MTDKYNAEINALRGVAILLTLAAHWWAGMVDASKAFKHISSWAQFWPGVYLFFVISGYVITLNFYETLSSAKDKSTALQFYKRRFFRLTPAAFTWIAITLTLALTIPSTYGDAKSNLIQATAALFWFYDFAWHYWGVSFGVFWSLSLEEQFYFQFPWLVLLKRNYVVGICVACITVLFFVHRQPIISKLIFFPVDALCWGLLLAFYRMYSGSYEKVRNRLSIAGGTKFLASSVLCVLLVIIPARLESITPATSITTVICAAIVFLAAHQLGYFNFGPVDRLMQKIGDISYELYLCHVPMLLLARTLSVKLGVKPYLQITFLSVAYCIAFGAASLTHKHVTNRFRKPYSRDQMKPPNLTVLPSQTTASVP